MKNIWILGASRKKINQPVAAYVMNPLKKQMCLDLREQTYGCRGRLGRGTVREFRKAYTLLHLNWITNKNLLYIAHGILLNVMCQSGWERSLGKNEYMYMYYGRVPSLFTSNYHNIVSPFLSHYKVKSLKF